MFDLYVARSLAVKPVPSPVCVVLQVALLVLSQSAKVTESVVKVTHAIYKELASAAKGQVIDWLVDLMSQHPVLLVRDGSTCRFVQASGGVYVPDNEQFMQLFSGDCTMLHVPPEYVPALQPLLQCIQPALPGLSTSVQCTCQAAVEDETVVQYNERLTELLHSVWPFAARHLYRLQQPQYEELLTSGKLEQLWGMAVYNMPGVLVVLELDGVQKQQEAVVAVQQQLVVGEAQELSVEVMYVNGSCAEQTIQLHMGRKCAELLAGNSGSNELSGSITTLLLLLAQSGISAAEESLRAASIGQIPQQLRFWSVPEDGLPSNSSAASQLGVSSGQGFGAVWEDSDDDDNKADVSSSSQQQHVDLVTKMANLQVSSSLPALDASPEGNEADTAFAAEAHDSRDAPSNIFDVVGDSIDRAGASSRQSRGSYSQGVFRGGNYYQRSQSHQRVHIHTAHISKSGAIKFVPADTDDAAVPEQDLQQGVQQMQAAAAAAIRASTDTEQLFPGMDAVLTSRAATSATVRGGSPAVWDVLSQQAIARAHNPTTEALISTSSPIIPDGEMASDNDNIPTAGKSDMTGSFTATRQVTHTLLQNTTVTDTLHITGTAAAAPAMAASSSSASCDASGQPAGMAPQELTGILGECFLFHLFKEALPGFDEHCWQSGYRVHAGLPAPDREPSYDFLYDDVAGKLTGVPGTKCVVDCKATGGRAVEGGRLQPIFISTREWDLAQKLHHEKSAAYIIVRVECVSGGQPRIAAVLVDPVKMMYEGRLGITGQSLQIISAPGS